MNLGVLSASFLVAVASLVLTPDADSAFLIVDEPAQAEPAPVEPREFLLYNRSTLPLVEIGRGEAARIGGAGQDVLLSVATPMILPVGWSIYAMSEDTESIGKLTVSWTGSSTWLDALRVMAMSNNLQVVVDWPERKVTINSNIEKGRWQKNVTPAAFESGTAKKSVDERPTMITLEKHVSQLEGSHARVLFHVRDHNSASNLQINPKAPLAPQLANSGLQITTAEAIGAKDETYLIVTDVPGFRHSTLYVIPPHAERTSDQVMKIGNHFGWSVGRPNEHVWLANQNPSAVNDSYQVVTSMEDALKATLSGRKLNAQLSGSSKTIYIKQQGIWGFK